MHPWKRLSLLILFGMALTGCSEFYGTPRGYEALRTKQPTSPTRSSPANDSPPSPTDARRTAPDSGSVSSGRPAARFYLGATGAAVTGTTQVEVNTTRLSLSGRGPDPIGLLFAGVEFRNDTPLLLGLEIDYMPSKLRTFEASSGSVSGEIRAKSAWFVSLLPAVEVTENVRIFGRLAFGQIHGEGRYTESGTTQSVDDTAKAVKFGVGARYDWSSGLFVRAEYFYTRSRWTDYVRLDYSGLAASVGFAF